VAREYVLPIRTYHWNSRLQSNRGLIQRFPNALLDAGAEKIHDNLHLRVNGVHAIADGVFKFPDVDHILAAEVKIGGADFSANQRIVYNGLNGGANVEMWGTGADKIAARLGLVPDARGVYNVPAGLLRVEAFAFTHAGQPNPSRSQTLNNAVGGATRGVRGLGALDD